MAAQENGDERNSAEMKKALSKLYKQMEQDQQIRSMLRQLLDDGAYERMMNIRVSNSELYTQLARLIVSLAQSNQIAGRITEPQLVSLLGRLTSRPDTKIEFKHK
ncbi:MAG: DNA-binding protein [Candidatus Marsarchaeota archaeon]|jgi:programmed cell death protein 5|nr:DNA-binding protein [Candidatus Marsarchaeota archaeon]